MVLAVRQFLTRIFGSEQVEQHYSVVETSQGPGAWDHYFPRNEIVNNPDGLSERGTVRSEREPVLQGK